MLDNNCIFCKIIKKEISANIVYEDEHVLAFKDINPKAPIHALIIPKVHIATVLDLDSDTSKIPYMQYMIDAANKIACENNIDKSGFRIVVNCNRDAGQEVFHVHVHLLGGRKFVWPPG